MKTEELESLSEYELERGKPMPSKNHSLLQSLIGSAILFKYKDQYSVLSELSLQFGSKPFTPDLCIYPKMTPDWFQDEIKVTEPPLTAIEILSPTQGAENFSDKFNAYFAAGVQSCWFVQPMMQTIFVISPDKKISVFHDDTLTDSANGIFLDLKEIFG